MRITARTTILASPAPSADRPVVLALRNLERQALHHYNALLPLPAISSESRLTLLQVVVHLQELVAALEGGDGVHNAADEDEDEHGEESPLPPPSAA